MWRQWAIVAVLALAGGIAGVYLGRWIDDGSSRTEARLAPEGIEAGDQRPEFELRGLDGNLYHVDDWQGEVLLINFWATWCAPCREEMPMLDALQEKLGGRGLKIVGIALDTPGAVQAFTESLGIDYTILLDGATGDSLARRFGNTQGVLPYSVLVGRDGRIIDMIYGELERAPLEKRLNALL